ncbi:uncharacterized protein LOC126778795 [Nymphalis io]|uniref:uncharacterized protein LOC126778795 n=1 Tax=Inachis io TaxID=171585 RepID=UPI0021676849|nr:uncharacterized protein LOC126778795 [Nymphalis io]
MNINRKDNGDWIFCPSKSIPGKFYHFNMRTGEAVWCQIETENKVPKNDKEINKSYEYLKPVSPPKENPMSNICCPRNCLVNESQHIHLSGDMTLPKYISNVPNITWTIQLPNCTGNLSEFKKQTSDRNTQTPESDRDTFVQTCAIPLSQRFTPSANSKTSMTPNTNINEDCASGMRFRSSTPLKNWCNTEMFNSNTFKSDKITNSMVNRKRDHLKFVLKEPQLKRQRTFPDRHCKYQLSFLTNLNSSFDLIENTNLNAQHKVENAIKNPTPGSNQELEPNDLRFFLQMKRRTSIENNLLKEPPNKRVKFNLDNNDDDGSSHLADGNEEIPKTRIPIKSLKDLNKDVNDIWYIIVDEDILMNDFNFIMDYINEDVLCKLLIPYSMVQYTESLGRGEHGGRDRVIFARRVYRYLVTSRQVQIVEIEDGSSLMDDIVKCCLQVMDEDIQIVFITKNFELEKVAKMYGIDVYSFDDIKNYLTNARESTGNNTEFKNNLQNINNFDPYVLSKSNLESRLKISQFMYNKHIDMNPANQTNGHLKDDFRHICDTTDNVNTENNSTDVCKRIEKLKIIVEKLTNKNNSIYINNEIEKSRNDPKTNQTDKSNDIEYRIEINQRKRNYLSKFTLNLEDNKDLRQNSKSTDNYMNYEKYNRPVASMDNLGDEQNLIEDEDVRKNIIERYDEWICCYVQIMEEFVHKVLQIHLNDESDMPYFLNEGLEFLKGIYSHSKAVRSIIEKMLTFNRLFTTKDFNKTYTELSDFMKMLECGFLLIEALKNILSEDFSEIEGFLVKLLESIENSKYFEEFETIETPLRRSDEDTRVLRRNFVKKRSYIVNYLKKHFVEWKNYVEVEKENTEDEELNTHMKIYRTSGRNLNTFKIDSHKRISFENPRDNLKSQEHGIDKVKQQSDVESPLNPILHRNTFNDKNGPKVIRNKILINEAEEKVNKATHLHLDILDYSEIVTLSSDSEISKDNKNNDGGTLDHLNNDFDMTEIKESLSLINDARNDSTVDSGFENEVHACSLIRSFLTELSSTLKLIYSFVDKCITELQCQELSDETKNKLADKANQTHTHIADVIEKLKSIIERESADSTLKTLFIKAGTDVIEDKRMTRYRQTVTKCLEQARVLESSLKIMMKITSEDCDVSLSSKNDITHFNIFE